MALKTFVFLAFLLTAVFADERNPFEFLKHLQGCHKGDNTNGIHNLKNYLHQFGYLNYHTHNNHSNDDHFDNLLESAVKTYQNNYNLKPTGVLDAKTVSTMSAPRCGVADIVNATTSMNSGKHHHHRKSLHSVSHFTFFQGSPKWSKSHLTYRFAPGTSAAAMSAVDRAFNTWDANTHFSFTRSSSHSNADMSISFHRRDHGDGSPFDGPGGTIAHAFAPQNGRFHYDGDDNFAVGAVPLAFDLETVALHEIGHLLGLGHSSIQGAIMFPTIATGVTKGLHGDDIQGIKALYNV